VRGCERAQVGCGAGNGRDTVRYCNDLLAIRLVDFGVGVLLGPVTRDLAMTQLG
jgi:hypothetical protein